MWSFCKLSGIENNLTTLNAGAALEAFAAVDLCPVDPAYSIFGDCALEANISFNILLKLSRVNMSASEMFEDFFWSGLNGKEAIRVLEFEENNYNRENLPRSLGHI